MALVAEGLCPVILRNGTVYGYSPRMRFDLVVNTFVKDALLARPALAARRRLDVAPAGRRPRRLGRDDRRAWRRPPSRCAARSSTCCTPTTRSASSRCSSPARSSCSGRTVTLNEEPAPQLTRDYECSNTKLATALGFQPSRSVVEAIDGILAAIDVEDQTMLTDPRYYNIRWLELLNEMTPQIDHFKAAL